VRYYKYLGVTVSYSFATILKEMQKKNREQLNRLKRSSLSFGQHVRSRLVIVIQMARFLYQAKSLHHLTEKAPDIIEHVYR